VAKVNAEVKRWAGENGGRVRYGVDLVGVQGVADDERAEVEGQGGLGGLVVAVKRSAELGEEFDEEYWIKRSSTNNFKKRVLSADELAAERANTTGDPDGASSGKSLDERFGADAPF
jgi:hypothetical protein